GQIVGRAPSDRASTGFVFRSADRCRLVAAAPAALALAAPRSTSTCPGLHSCRRDTGRNRAGSVRWPRTVRRQEFSGSWQLSAIGTDGGGGRSLGGRSLGGGSLGGGSLGSGRRGIEKGELRPQARCACFKLQRLQARFDLSALREQQIAQAGLAAVVRRA